MHQRRWRGQLSLVLVVLSILQLAACATSTKTNDQIPRSTFPVFAVTTSPKERVISAGSAFAISRSGMLATAYHVVANAIVDPMKARVVVLISGRKVEAAIIAFDVINDLTLIQIDQNLADELPLRETPLEKGEPVFAQGYENAKNFHRLSGAYIEMIADTKRHGLRCSIDVLNGMSGGPLLDQDGKIIGLNTEASRDQTHQGLIATPSRALVELIEKARLTKNSFDSSTAQHQVQQQLLEVAGALTEDWKANRARDLLLSDWHLESRGSVLRCFTETSIRRSSKALNGEAQITAEYCPPLFETAPVSGRIAGHYSIVTVSARNAGLTDMEFQDIVRTLNDESALDVSKPFDRRLSDDGIPYACTVKRMINGVGVPLQVTSCLRSYPQFPLLYDCQAKVRTELRHGRQQLIGTIAMYGFGSSHIETIFKSWIEGIGPATRRPTTDR